MTASPLPLPPGSGLGFSSSSRAALLRAVADLGSPFCLDRAASRALAAERAAAGGLPIAAQDVYAIAYGGVQRILTGAADPADVRAEPVPHDPEWLARVVVVAYDPLSPPHDAPGLLAALFAHKCRREFVGAISAMARMAGEAIAKSDAASLATALNGYRKVFNRWCRGLYAGAVEPFVTGELIPALPPSALLGWKAPGAGACRSLALIMRDDPDGESAAAAIGTLRARGWVAGPLRIAPGVQVREDGVVDAGFRLDFVGAADLGQHPNIAADGECCACAIELPMP